MCVINFKSDDEYMTPFSAWQNIIRFIPQEKAIWECFFGDGSSGQHLRDLGCTNIIHDKIDFFTSDRGEVIISNPPFSLKKQVFIEYIVVGFLNGSNPGLFLFIFVFST